MSKVSIGFRAIFLLCMGALVGCDGGSDSGEQGATETNFQPAPCEDDSNCGEGGTCTFPDGDDEPGVCDGDEMVVGGSSSAAPAPCSSDDDCPAGVRCEGVGDASVGFCDVAEATVSGGGGGASLGAPAPCSSSDDCGGAQCVIADGDTLGFCDVDEMLVDR